jgi:hypothetical protein
LRSIANRLSQARAFWQLNARLGQVNDGSRLSIYLGGVNTPGARPPQLECKFCDKAPSGVPEALTINESIAPIAKPSDPPVFPER